MTGLGKKRVGTDMKMMFIWFYGRDGEKEIEIKYPGWLEGGFWFSPLPSSSPLWTPTFSSLTQNHDKTLFLCFHSFTLPLRSHHKGTLRPLFGELVFRCYFFFTLSFSKSMWLKSPQSFSTDAFCLSSPILLGVRGLTTLHLTGRV